MALTAIPPKCDCGERMRVYTERQCFACGRIGIHDVEDVAGWVHAAINKRWQHLPGELRDELAAEGMRIVRKMARDYQPGRGGRDQAASTFTGYLGQFLPGKLVDAWHRLEDHTLSTQTDGSRAWDVKPAEVSLDALAAADGPGVDGVAMLQHEDTFDGDPIGDLPRLDAWWERRRAQVIRYSELRSQGYRNGEIADELELLPAQVKELERFARETLRRPGAMSA